MMKDMKTEAQAQGRPQLSLHVRLADRTELKAQGAVQGELFETSDSKDLKRGYKGPIAAKVAGITYRQLDYWARKQIVEPSITPSHGSGSRRLYSFKDVVILAVSKRLLDAGVNLQNVNKAISFLMSHESKDLEQMTILCDGQRVVDCQSDRQMMELMSSGQAIFGVSVSVIWHKVEASLDQTDYVDLTDSQVKAHPGRVIDELAERRLRKRIELQKAQRQEHRARVI